MFYDIEAFINKLYKKYPPSTIMKSYQFIVYREHPTCIHVKIASNTIEELVYDLRKGSRTRARIYTLPIPIYVQTAL